MQGEAGRAGPVQNGEGSHRPHLAICILEGKNWVIWSHRFFSVESRDRTRGVMHKLKYKQCQLNERKLFFIVTVIKHCHRLPRESAQGSGLGDTQKSSKKTFLLQYFPYLPKPTLSIPSMIAKLAKLFKNSCLTYSTELFFFTGRQTVI